MSVCMRACVRACVCACVCILGLGSLVKCQKPLTITGFRVYMFLMTCLWLDV